MVCITKEQKQIFRTLKTLNDKGRILTGLAVEKPFSFFTSCHNWKWGRKTSESQNMHVKIFLTPVGTLQPSSLYSTFSTEQVMRCYSISVSSKLENVEQKLQTQSEPWATCHCLNLRKGRLHMRTSAQDHMLPRFLFKEEN